MARLSRTYGGPVSLSRPRSSESGVTLSSFVLISAAIAANANIIHTVLSPSPHLHSPYPLVLFLSRVCTWLAYPSRRLPRPRPAYHLLLHTLRVAGSFNRFSLLEVASAVTHLQRYSDGISHAASRISGRSSHICVSLLAPCRYSPAHVTALILTSMHLHKGRIIYSP
ncbi:hypothetical protein EI94DRAFT_1021618 [Lactarius quietus]|nr:hypothetical protein EI94DRAFT_1021618 [Lactarius quietus]